MRNHYWLACGAFSCMGKDWQPPQSPFVQIGPNCQTPGIGWRSRAELWRMDKHGPAGNRRARGCSFFPWRSTIDLTIPSAVASASAMARASAPSGAGAPGASQALAATWPEAGAAYKYPQMGLTPPRLGTDKPKLLYVTKNTLIYLRKVQNVLSFLLFRGHLIAI